MFYPTSPACNHKVEHMVNNTLVVEVIRNTDAITFSELLIWVVLAVDLRKLLYVVVYFISYYWLLVLKLKRRRNSHTDFQYII